MSADEYSLLGLLADIRAAAGDPQGRLMQPELVEHIRAMKARADEFDTARSAWLAAQAVNQRTIGRLQAEIDRLRAEVEAMRSDVITLGDGLRNLVLALAHAASDPLYAESYQQASQLLAQLTSDSHTAQRGEGE